MRRPASAQRGMVMAVVLALLLAILLLTVSAARFTASGLRLSGNEELRLEAATRSQSVVDALIDEVRQQPDRLQVPELTCMPGAPECAGQITRLPPALQDLRGTVAGRIRRLAPALAPPPEGYSARCFQTAQFEAAGSYDGTVEGRGRATIVEGFEVIVQSGPC